MLEDFWLELIKHLEGSRWILSVISVGIVLILVNIVTNALIERRRERELRRELVRRNLKPVLKAAGELISRLSEILITHNGRILRDIQSYQQNNVCERIQKLTPLTMNRHESTAYRLVNFLAVANYFGRQTADIPSFNLLNRVEYYVQHKIPVALRGYLYGISLLSREVQEELAVSLLENYSSERANDLSVGQFCKLLKSEQYNPELFDAVLKVLAVNTEPIQGNHEMGVDDPTWKHILALSQLTIYLIDLFQELGEDCQWEEHRLLLVSIIKHWNKRSVRRVYLYEPGDLDADNYLDTFPGRIVEQHLLQIWINRILGRFRIRPKVTRLGKRVMLNLRGTRFHRRHYVKVIRSWGVQIRGRNDIIRLRCTGDLLTLKEQVQTHLTRHVIN